MTVASDSFNNSISRAPSAASSRSTSTTLAPLIRGKKSSRPNMSKEIVVTERTVSSEVQPRLTLHRTKKIDKRTVGDLDAFGSSRRTGCVNHVGQDRSSSGKSLRVGSLCSEILSQSESMQTVFPL